MHYDREGENWRIVCVSGKLEEAMAARLCCHRSWQ